MTEAFSLMLWPLLACFVLVGIHAYLGIHVIARKVIFVDLALAQIAALGAVYGVFIGLSFELNSLLVKAVSVGFTLLGALLFSFTRTPDERVPHEAIIGIIYAVALSMTLLLTANLPHGGDEVRQLLSGSILWVTPKEVIFTALLYASIGVIHIVFRKQFFLLSLDDALKKTSLNVKLWDFLFYATFGVVVTSSVGMGGVLLVFGYLVIPSVLGVMLASTTKKRLMIGWGSGLIMSFLGVVVSYYLDLPSGPTIVVALGVLLLAVTIALELKEKQRRRLGVIHLLLFILVVMVLGFVPVFLEARHDAEDKKARAHILTHDVDKNQQIQAIESGLASSDDQEVINALTAIKEHNLKDLLPKILPFLSVHDDKKRALATDVLQSLHDERAIPPLKTAAFHERDVFIKIEMARALLSLKDKEGLFVLRAIMNEKSSSFAEQDAYHHLQEWLIHAPSGQKELSEWLGRNRERIMYDHEKKKFSVQK